MRRHRVSSSPSSRMLPSVQRTSPMIAFSVVVLPAPLRPSSAWISAGLTCRLTPFSTRTLSYPQ
jgi:hypothetical protein